MPVIEIRSDLGGTYLSTLSVMLFPRNEEKRGQWLAAGAVLNMQGGCTSMDLNDWAERLYELTQGPERTFYDGFKSIPRAMLTGNLFIYLLILARHLPHLCRVECAQALVQKFHHLPSLNYFESDKRAGVSDKSPSDSLIKQAWARFRPVSHLWAVYTYRSEGSGLPGAAGWPEILADSEALRKTAEKQGFMRTSDMWRAPENIIPSEMIEPPNLSNEMLAYLRSDFPHLID